MAQLNLSPEEIKEINGPLVAVIEELSYKLEILNAVVFSTTLLTREQTERILKTSAPTLKKNAEKWNLNPDKGKRKIKFPIPNVIKHMEAKRMFKPAIVKELKLVFGKGEVLEAV